MSTRYCEHTTEIEGVTAHRCGKEAIVGWGNPAVWLCQQHFEQALDRTRELIQDIENELRVMFIDRG